MIRILMVALMSCTLIGGCLSVNGARHYVEAAKPRFEQCNQPGVVQIVLVFQGSTPANLSVTFHSFRPVLTDFALRISNANGSEEKASSVHWEKPRDHDWLDEGENGTLVWGFARPVSRWRDAIFEYAYLENGHSIGTALHCSFADGNAPWAFAP
jgi:hypothetical protein